MGESETQIYPLKVARFKYKIRAGSLGQRNWVMKNS